MFVAKTMLLKLKNTEDLIKVVNLEELISPAKQTVQGRDQMGQEEQNIADYAKSELAFPSGEDLPRCWWDSEYRTQA